MALDECQTFFMNIAVKCILYYVVTTSNRLIHRQNIIYHSYLNLDRNKYIQQLKSSSLSSERIVFFRIVKKHKILLASLLIMFLFQIYANVYLFLQFSLLYLFYFKRLFIFRQNRVYYSVSSGVFLHLGKVNFLQSLVSSRQRP